VLYPSRLGRILQNYSALDLAVTTDKSGPFLQVDNIVLVTADK